VAVVVRDRRERMLRCLEAVLAQRYPSFDVLVIDNCSVDGTADAVRARAATAPVPVRVEDRPGSVGHLRNEAVRLATGEVIAFTDSDCVPDPDWLVKAAQRFADHRVGVVQGRTLPDEPVDRPWPATQHIVKLSLLFECCNLLYRTEAIRGSDGFNEATRLSAFGEDIAAGWSVLRQGWEVVFEPEAVVLHDVTYPGLSWHLRRALRYEVFPALVRDYPELRRRLFWGRWFLTRRYAALPAALAGLLLAPVRPGALVLVVPYAWFRWPAGLRLRTIHGQAQGTAYDLAALAGLIRGSVRYRRIVL
jgi:cellulose synthase/poly-beta-1,6-N-acetylglucosamine synthase-like glycosyltransferase